MQIIIVCWFSLSRSRTFCVGDVSSFIIVFVLRQLRLWSCSDKNNLSSEMNFNRRDSLQLSDVLDDPRFLSFLRKWETDRKFRNCRAIFSSNLSWFRRIFIFASLCSLIYVFFLLFHDFSPPTQHYKRADSESPAPPLIGAATLDPLSPGADVETNQISASYELEQFPIEQIEKKMMLQRHLTAKWVDTFNYLFSFYEFDSIRCTIAVIIRVKFCVVT